MHIFSPPSSDDLIRLLKAWRFWVVGALLGAAIGAAAFFIAPPDYRAQATVLVDFNLEEAWPEDTDRQQFYYLERESRKLEEIAWSDSVMERLSSGFGFPIKDLRGGKLILSQPAEGGWHFYALDPRDETANALASAWAQAFAEEVTQNVASSQSLNAFIEAEATQVADLPVERSQPLSTYLFVGTVGFLALSALVSLFFNNSK